MKIIGVNRREYRGPCKLVRDKDNTEIRIVVNGNLLFTMNNNEIDFEVSYLLRKKVNTLILEFEV
ncbi:MAG: hypothetical protein QXY18_00215 [Nitrososphaerota archaeon]